LDQTWHEMKKLLLHSVTTTSVRQNTPLVTWDQPLFSSTKHSIATQVLNLGICQRVSCQ